MSRYIDPAKPLSKADREYLHSRGMHEQADNWDGRANTQEAPEVLDVGDDDTYDDTSEWKVEDLRAELKGRDLVTTGNRAELVARLRESDAAE